MRDDALVVLVPSASGCSFVLDASSVQAIDDAAAANGAVRDLARYGSQPIGRALLTDRGWVLIGDRVVVRRLPREAFGPLPPWIDSVAQSLPLSALVRIDEGFAYQIDLDRLFDSVDS